MRTVNFGNYYPGKGWLHRLDPRAKLLALAILAVCIFVISQILVFSLQILIFGILFVILFPLCLSAHLSVWALFRGVRPFLFFFMLIFLFHVLGGSSTGGWKRGIEALLRFAVLVGLATVITATVQPTAMAKALGFFLRPLNRLGISHRHGALMAALTLRFIPLLQEEGERRRRAQQARGYSPKGRPVSYRLKILAAYYSGIHRDLLQRARQWAKALVIKCYQS